MSTRLAWILVVALAGSGCAAVRPPPPPRQGLLPALPGPSNGRVAITGRVDDATTGRPIAGALVLISCTCLVLYRTVETSDDGTYFLGDLPPGQYSVQALYAGGNISKTFAVPPGARFAVNFAVDSRPFVYVHAYDWSGNIADRSLLSDGCPHWRYRAPQCRQEYPRPVRVTHMR